MEKIRFIFEDNIGIDYNNFDHYRLLKSDTIPKIKKSMLEIIEDMTFRLNRSNTKTDTLIERFESDIKEVKTVYSYLLDEMLERTAQFTFDDTVNYQYELNKTLKAFNEALKGKKERISIA